MGIFHLGGSGGGGPVIAADVSFDNDASGLAATDVQAAIDETLLAHDDASEINYDNGVSGLDATDVKAAIDEVVAEQFTVTPRLWEALDWVSFFAVAGAPSSSVGYWGAYYFDLTAEELYGPASFDPGIPGWDWGTALANVEFGVDGPMSASGGSEWYIWDENGDGSVYTFFQKKTAFNHDDLIRSQSGFSWEGVSNQVDADKVWFDTHPLATDPDFAIVKSVKSELLNLNTNLQYGYLGGRSYILEDTVSGNVTINPFDANAFQYTITGNTTFSFQSGLNALDSYNLGTRFAEIIVLLIQDGEGGHTVGWSGNIWWNNNDNAVQTQANHRGIWKFVSWDDGTTWYGHRWGNNFQD